MINKSGVSFNFDMIVIDSYQVLKSYSSKDLKHYLKVKTHVARIVGLTGYTSSNGLMDMG